MIESKVEKLVKIKKRIERKSICLTIRTYALEAEHLKPRQCSISGYLIIAIAYNLIFIIFIIIVYLIYTYKLIFQFDLLYQGSSEIL